MSGIPSSAWHGNVRLVCHDGAREVHSIETYVERLGGGNLLVIEAHEFILDGNHLTHVKNHLRGLVEGHVDWNGGRGADKQLGPTLTSTDIPFVRR